MDEVFAVIGKLYFDLIRANNIIEVLRKQQTEPDQAQSQPNVDNA